MTLSEPSEGLVSNLATSLAFKRVERDKMTALVHELRSPLSPILTALHILEKNHDPKVVEASIAIIRRQANYMKGLIDDVYDLSRIEHGKLTLQQNRVDLNAVVSAALEIVHDAARRRNVHIDTELPAEPLFISCDSGRLIQVVTNLVLNAIKYGHEGGHVLIKLCSHADHVTLDVSDDGPGVPEKLKEKLFDMYEQGEASTEGLGIGLSLVKKLVELHSCKVSYHDNTPRGARFRVELPYKHRKTDEISVTL